LTGWTSQSAVGILAEQSEGLDFSGIKLLQFRKPARLTACRDLSLGLAINQPEGGGDGPAVSLNDCAEALVTTRVKGAPASFTAGILVAGARTHALNITLSTIRDESVGGNNRRVVTAGVPASAVTLS